jgi:Zn-dependent protease with chaperone function
LRYGAAVTREETDVLIQRLEEVARQNPKGYPVRVGFWAAFGYGYLLAILFITLSLAAGVVYFVIKFPNAGVIKIGIFALILVGGLGLAILSALRVRLEPPRGLPLTRAKAPALFAALDDIHQRLRSVKPHDVLLVGDLNAAVVQTPRLGVFGWQRNSLILGLPLMQALTPEEFRAVLAHEFAHLSRNHARFGAWIYRIRRTWERVFEELGRHKMTDMGVLSGFIKWYWPRFNAHAFVLARANEYEADACSAALTSAGTAASALMRVRVLAEQFDESFWPSIYKQANERPEPPEGVYVEAGRVLRAGPTPDEAARWLKQGFLIPTSNADTHPCLRDRLRALDALPPGIEQGSFPDSLPPLGERTAAEFFLGPELEACCKSLSNRWRKDITEGWKKRHAEAKKLIEKLGARPEAIATAIPSNATVAQLWEKAETLFNLEGDAAALPLVEQILLREPEHAVANFIRGRHLLSTDDPSGIAYLERAMTSDETLVLDGVNLIYGHYSRTGQKHKLRELETRADAHQELVNKANAERNRVTAADTFLPPDLKPEEEAKIREICADEFEIVSAEIARKEVTHLPKLPLFIVCLRLDVPFLSFRSSTANQKLVGRMVEKIKLPGNFLVFIAQGELKPLGKKISAVPGSVIYRAKE